MKVSNVVLNAMLDNSFYGTVSGQTYQLKIKISSGTQPSNETIAFKEAGSGGLSNGVTELTAGKFIPIAAGTTVTGIQVIASSTGVIVDEDITPEAFSEVGTITINNIVVQLTGN